MRKLALATLIVISSAWIANQTPVEWTVLKTDSIVFRRIFSEKELSPNSLTEMDAKKAIEILRTNFEPIKSEVKLNKSLSLPDYRFQFVGAMNGSKEKLVFVNGVGKKLPKWSQSKWETDLVVLKCVNDDLVSLRLNLNKAQYYQVNKAECH